MNLGQKCLKTSFAFVANRLEPFQPHFRLSSVDRHTGPPAINFCSFIIKGDTFEAISVVDGRNNEDAFLQPVRKDIHKEGLFKGKCAEMFRIFMVGSRRVAAFDGNTLLQSKVSKDGDRFPRSCILRLLPDNFGNMTLEDQKKERHQKVLNGAATVS